jgi:2OG-Fe(II) oxygenase superfamily
MTHAQSILVKALYLEKMNISKLVRIRGGMTTRTPYPVVHAPHVDWDNFHMTALYYVNDADGETIFYKETREETETMSSFEWAKDRQFTVLQKVQPKADRMVLFDGRIYHSSTSPTTVDYRLTINYNWLP